MESLHFLLDSTTPETLCWLKPPKNFSAAMINALEAGRIASPALAHPLPPVHQRGHLRPLLVLALLRNLILRRNLHPLLVLALLRNHHLLPLPPLRQVVLMIFIPRFRNLKRNLNRALAHLAPALLVPVLALPVNVKSLAK